MAKTKQQKTNTVSQLIDQLSTARSVVISQFTKLGVNDDQRLRSEMHQNNVNYVVVKKTLLARALADAKLDSADLSDVNGNVSIAVSDDEVLAAKVVHSFSKDQGAYSIIAGYLEGKLVNGSKVIELASLPGKNDLIGLLLSRMNAPVSNFVGALGGVSRNLVCVLSAIKEQKS